MLSALRQNAVVLTAIFAAFHLTIVAAAELAKVDWLRGSGKDLELCLKGEVFAADGEPAADFQLSGKMDARTAMPPLEPVIDGNQFKIWVKVNQPAEYKIAIQVKSAKSDQAAFRVVKPYELRQAAAEGIKLTLQTPPRTVTVKVTDEGQSAGNATVMTYFRNGCEMKGTTNDEGVVSFKLFPAQQLWRLIAQTEDHRVGGYSFYQGSPHDPEADNHEIQLSRCRDLKVRLVTADGAAAKGINLKVQYNMPSHNYLNHVAIADTMILTTDAAGEVVYPWLPYGYDVPYYVEIPETPWILSDDARIDGDFVVYKIKSRQPRNQITGRIFASKPVENAAGFFVALSSPQGEKEFYSDSINVFTNADGTFVADVLFDCRYGCYVFDALWVGEIIDLVPYDSKILQQKPLELAVREGQPVKVVATAGPNRKPIPNAEIEFRRHYEFPWQQENKQKWKSIDLRWSAKGDALGIVVTHTLPGELGAQLRTPNWADYKWITVPADKPATLHFHRELESARTVTGRLVLEKGVTANLKDAEIQIGSGAGKDKPITCDANGLFKFETFGLGALAIARTADAQAFGTFVSKESDEQIEIKLTATQDYHGKLLGKGDTPAADSRITATIKIDVPHFGGSAQPLTLEWSQFEATTDQQGNFTLPGVPTQRDVSIYCTSLDRKRYVCLDRIRLNPNESLPRKVFRLESFPEPPKEAPLADRFQTALSDCSATGRRLMLILAHDSEAVKAFVDENYLDSKQNKDLEAYTPIVVPIDWNLLKATDITFISSRPWGLPLPGTVSAYVFDTDGKCLGRKSVSIMCPGQAEVVAEFIHQHIPEAQAAKEK